jgi:acyl-CoA synthetase (AMP-forming)/AMP-acid ligase II
LLTAKRGSIGKGIPGVELRVVDPFDMPVGPGQPGLLQARGENVMLGYWRDPEGSARVLRGGWLNTGDQATTDEDGFVYLRGRANQLVKIQGNRVHPAEVEEVLLRHFPQAQVAVLPFEPDEVTRLALFLAPPDGTPVSDREVRQICLRELPRHKIPSHIEVLERLPLNDALKIDRQALALRLASPDCGIQETAPCLS